MDKPEVTLRRPLNGFITALLNQNESLYHVSLVLGTHAFRFCSSTDPVVHASKHSALGQTWAGLQYNLQQITSRNPFIYCEEEQDLRCEESDAHPRHLEENVTGEGVTSDGYVEVQSAPYAYDQGTEAKRDDPKSSSLVWLSHPLILGVTRSRSITSRILHLLCGSVKTIGRAKWGRA